MRNTSVTLGPLKLYNVGIGVVLAVWAVSFALWIWFVYLLIMVAKHVHAWPF